MFGRDVLNQNRKCEQKIWTLLKKVKKTGLMKSATTSTKMIGAMMNTRVKLAATSPSRHFRTWRKKRQRKKGGNVLQKH